MWLANSDIQRYLDIHRFEEVLWFNKERFDAFVWWMAVLAVFGALSEPKASASLLVERLLLVYQVAQKLLQAGQKSGYQVAKLIDRAQ